MLPLPSSTVASRALEKVAWGFALTARAALSGGLALTVTAARAVAQTPATPPQPAGDGATPQFAPPLPTEGLLRRETWVALGKSLGERVVESLPSLLAALIVLLAFVVISRVAARLVRTVVGRTRADPAMRTVSARLVSYSILVFGLLMAGAQAGLQIGSLLAGVSIVGLAVGLAAQESLANMMSGLTILWERPFRTGDNVTIADTFGEVQEIRIRTTRIRTVDRRDMILPNQQVLQNPIINHTLHPELRLDLPVSIAYWEDSREARRVLLDAVAGHPLIDHAAANEVVMVGLGESSVDLHLRVWLADAKSERRAWVEILELAKIALDEAGIDIPFPQRTLHLASDTAPLSIRRAAAGAET